MKQLDFLESMKVHEEVRRVETLVFFLWTHFTNEAGRWPCTSRSE